MSVELDCERIAADLVDLAEGAGPSARLEDHLWGCADCRDLLSALRTAPVRLAESGPADDPARWERQRRRILEAIDDSRDAARRSPRRLHGWLAVAAAFLLVLVGVERLSQQATTPAGPFAETARIEALPDDELLGIADTFTVTPSFAPDLESLTAEDLDALDELFGSDLV